MKAFLALLSASVAVLLVECRKQEALDRFRNPSGQKTGFDHSAWDALLKRYVDSQGRVDYARWKKDGTDKIDAYLDTLRAAEPSKFTRSEALAFWINAYNALTIRGVLHFYPIRSIKEKVNRFPGGYNIWRDYRIEIEGKKVSLDDIEHRILRPMGDPRVHFAINCASRGCVRLFNRAYTAGKIDAQLDEAGRAFFRNPEKFRIENGKVYISELFSWFGEDFGETPKAQLLRVRHLLPEEARAWVEKRDSIEFEFLDWDWSLNQR